MREIRTSGLMSGEGKRSVSRVLTAPRPSSTLQIVGRKRHIAVDTDGRLLMVNLTTADISDSAGAQIILECSATIWMRRILTLFVAPHSRASANAGRG